MKKGSAGMVVFTAVFVMFVMSLFEFSTPLEGTARVIIAGLSALAGGVLGTKLFPAKK